MLGFGAIAFATPWILTAVAALPILWWLLRLTPPSPRVVAFPAIRLLRDLISREQTPARTPLWLVLLRMLLALLVILPLAHPLINPNAAMPGSGPVVVVVDDGWASGQDWASRQRAIDDVIDQADRTGRDVVILTTAPSANGETPRPVGPMRANDARRLVQGLRPLPWPTDRAAALAALRERSLTGPAHAVWISDGLGDDAAPALAETLQRLGSLEVLTDGPTRLPHLLLPPATDGEDLVARLSRADATAAEALTVRMSAEDGRTLAVETARFAAGERTTEVRIDLPVELRNEATRLQIENETTAAAGVLLDERWRRRPVGLVSGRPEGENQPLLGDIYYLERALAPFSEVRRGDIDTLPDRSLAVLMLADVGALTTTEAETIGAWVAEGGVLVRFAGPRLAQNADDLVPVRLRLGDRVLGGALSWSEPARLAPFPENGPFHDLTVPADVSVRRQVLAEPAVDLAEKTWARLEDGTPLVTAEKRGDGWIVLVHTTANPDWSNLALSGLFVQMLQRTVALSEGVAGTVRTGTLEPLEIMDGQGRLVPPAGTVFPIAGEAFEETAVSPRHPPGFYGTQDSRRALNLAMSVTDVRPLADLPAGVMTGGYEERGEIDLKPWLLAAALMLAAIDLVIALALRGFLGGFRRRGAARAAAIAAAVVMTTGLTAEVRAQDDNFALQASTETYLAYVTTGDRTVDETTHAGLEGLATVLAQRTAVEAVGALGLDIEQDELAFFPLIYWALSPAQPPLSDAARAKLNEYLRNGGTILFDTRDQNFGALTTMGGGPGAMRLQEVVEGLDIPPLAPVPADHVLTKAFYLLTEFPGRYVGGDVWVEAREDGLNDGVSSVIIGSNDWAGAWAVDQNMRPLNAVVPGGERQRELAFRFGVNVVMYALTGNYKADQVHVPAILERLGQ